jgi:hypothetical protein
VSSELCSILLFAYFRKAEDIEPGFYKRNQYMIAVCYEKLGKKFEAKQWLERANSTPTSTTDDKEVRIELEKLAKKLGVTTQQK